MAWRVSYKRAVPIWQLLFILLGTSWLWAPAVNDLISYRTSLISQYEAPFQPYSWLFRLADVLAASLLILVAAWQIKQPTKKLVGYILLIIGAGMLLDPILPTTCRLTVNTCQEYFSPAFLIHAIETTITGLGLFIIGVYDYWLRRRLVSAAFILFQIVYFGLFLTQLANQDRFNTFSQFIYQTVLIIWLAWFCGELLTSKIQSKSLPARSDLVKYGFATWAFVNGLLAIVVSLAHLHLLGRIRGLYFAGDSSWLAEHGVVVGVIMLYLSRHLARGELRARQIFLLITGIEALKYSVITPHPLLMAIYLLTFCILFISGSNFDRGAIPMTLRLRIKEALFMAAALLLAALIALLALYRSDRLSVLTSQSIDNFFDYTLSHKIIPKTHLESARLARTESAFLLATIGAMIWTLFRPYRRIAFPPQRLAKVKQLLGKYSKSSEDYFKLWPRDKKYFWAPDQKGFIAYKITGPIAFVLADPVGPKKIQSQLIAGFTAWCRARRLRTCFLPISQKSLAIYEKNGLQPLQIGASALIDIENFLQATSKDKWWRWKKNQALKRGYKYLVSQPPHSKSLLTELKKVSDVWLSDDRQERGFALGHFNKRYLRNCRIHYLIDSAGQAVAFTNQVPQLRPSQTATVDLLRFKPEAGPAMAYLLLNTIENLSDSYKFFDLGFVPFTASKEPIVNLARILSAGRFSAKGLEQFKNKFEPQWQPNYLAYDGDLGDLTLIAINLEKVMDIKHLKTR